MISVMMNDPDPKFKESKFLGFLNKLNNGSWVIEGKDIIKKDDIVE